MFFTTYVSPQLKEMKLGFVMPSETLLNLLRFKVNLLFGKFQGTALLLRDLSVNRSLRWSPIFSITEFSKNVGTLYEHCLKHGFSSAWGQLIDSLDPLGERNALKVSFKRKKD